MIYIYCNAGGKHGLGHVKRMHALALSLCSSVNSITEKDISFVSLTPGVVQRYIGKFSVIDPEKAYYHLRPYDIWIEDDKRGHATRQELVNFTGNGIHTVSIDNPEAVDAWNLVVAPGFHWNAETIVTMRKRFGDQFLCGPQYAILHPNTIRFLKMPSHIRQGIVFCAGGSDPGGLLRQMWRWTHDLALPTEAVFLCGVEAGQITGNLAGRAMPTSRGIPKEYAWRIREAALVVGMLGQTTYECRYYETPMLCFTRPTDGKVCLRNLCMDGGTLEQYDARSFCNLITDTWHFLQAKPEEQYWQVDGEGARRVAEAILAL